MTIWVSGIRTSGHRGRTESIPAKVPTPHRTAESTRGDALVTAHRPPHTAMRTRGKRGEGHKPRTNHRSDRRHSPHCHALFRAAPPLPPREQSGRSGFRSLLAEPNSQGRLHCLHRRSAERLPPVAWAGPRQAQQQRERLRAQAVIAAHDGRGASATEIRVDGRIIRRPPGFPWSGNRDCGARRSVGPRTGIAVTTGRCRRQRRMRLTVVERAGRRPHPHHHRVVLVGHRDRRHRQPVRHHAD